MDILSPENITQSNTGSEQQSWEHSPHQGLELDSPPPGGLGSRSGSPQCCGEGGTGSSQGASCTSVPSTGVHAQVQLVPLGLS